MNDAGLNAGIVAMVLVVCVLLGSRIKKQRKAQSKSLPRYKIFTIGTRAAGKTCFLASIFHKLSVSHPKVGFYLEASSAQAVALRELYAQIADPGAEWPEGTSKEQEWVFTAVVPSAGGDRAYPVFEFSYMDYAGGSFSNPQKVESVQRRIDEADALLVLIDGEKVAACLDGTATARRSTERLASELESYLPCLNKAGKKPVHFLISKCDLLREFSLEEVRDCLLSHHQFAAVIDARRERRISTRLIPVSAVGDDFARRNGKLPGMVKSKQAQPRPERVELSIVATLCDAFEAQMAELPAEKRRALAKVATINEGSAQWHYILSIIEGFSIFPPLTGIVAIRPLIKLIIERQERLKEVEPPPRLAAVPVEGVDDAVQVAIQKHCELLARFEFDFPDSILVAAYEPSSAARG